MTGSARAVLPSPCNSGERGLHRFRRWRVNASTWPAGDHMNDLVIAAYLDRRLSAPDRQLAEMHLASCAECRGELAQFFLFLQRARRPRVWLSGASSPRPPPFFSSCPDLAWRPLPQRITCCAMALSRRPSWRMARSAGPRSPGSGLCGASSRDAISAHRDRPTTSDWSYSSDTAVTLPDSAP